MWGHRTVFIAPLRMIVAAFALLLTVTAYIVHISAYPPVEFLLRK